jgi:hypothetical protein
MIRPLWTCPRAAHLMEQELGGRYHEGQVWKTLGSLGWSPQPVAGRTQEPNERQIRQWNKNVWPGLKKALPEGRILSLCRLALPERAAPSALALGAPAWAHAGAALQRPLENFVAGCRADGVERLFSLVSQFDQEGASAGLFQARMWASAGTAIAALGPAGWPTAAACAALYSLARGLDSSAASAPEPPDLNLGPPEAARTTQPCPKHYRQLTEAAVRTLRRMRRRPTRITAFSQQALWPE